MTKIDLIKLNGNIETLTLDAMGWKYLKAAMLDGKKWFNYIVTEATDSDGGSRVVTNRWYNLEQIDHIDVQTVNKETLMTAETSSTTRTSSINKPTDSEEVRKQKSANFMSGFANGFHNGMTGRQH